MTKLAMSLSKLNELVTTGNDTRDQFLQTSNMLTAELQEILTFVNITTLNSKVEQLRNNMEQLTDLVVKNFNYLNEFFNNQIREYNQLGENLSDAASGVNSGIN